MLQNLFYHRDLYYTILLLVERKILMYLCPQTLTFERELVILLKSNFPVSVASSVSYLSLRHCISYGLCCITQTLGNSSRPDSSRCSRVNQCFVLSFFFFFNHKSIAPRQGKCLRLISCRCKLSCERPVHMY